MRKDLDLGSGGEYAQHSRNTALGKAGVNRVKRRRAKRALGQDDAAAKPKSPVTRKRYGIKTGKYCRWYPSERARDDAYDALLKQSPKWSWLSMKPSFKVQR